MTTYVVKLGGHIHSVHDTYPEAREAAAGTGRHIVKREGIHRGWRLRWGGWER